MNKKQKICLWAGIVIIVLMGIFSPWMHDGRIDASHLLVQWAMVATVTGGLIVTLNDKKSKDS